MSRRGEKRGRVIGITARVHAANHARRNDTAEKLSLGWQHRKHQADDEPARAKAVIIATGGSTSNINFRRMFDPRMTPVIQVGGEPYSYQDASGELAAMAIGASLWGLVNQTLENGATIRTQRALATKYNYMAWKVESPIFPLVRATGFNVKDWQDVILVNQVGKRFYDETKGDVPHGNLGDQITRIRQTTIAMPRTSSSIRRNTTFSTRRWR